MKKYLSLMSAVALGTVASAGWAALEWDDADVFAELNDTDGDLGFHALIDGPEWFKLTIETPEGRDLMEVRARGKLRRQGMTELFFESAEPSFDDRPAQKFFNRFPEGEYVITGVALENRRRIIAMDEFSHVMPAPPDNVSVSGVALSDDCDANVPLVSEPITISWDPVTTSHPDIGATGAVEIDYYQVVVEREEPELLIYSVDLPSSVTSVEVPSTFIALGDEFKYEILVKSDTGNKTAVESCFEVSGGQ